MIIQSTKRYLGDGVYAAINDAQQLELTTENGISTTNKIYLEPEVASALVDYIAMIKNLAMRQAAGGIKQ